MFCRLAAFCLVVCPFTLTDVEIVVFVCLLVLFAGCLILLVFALCLVFSFVWV